MHDWVIFLGKNRSFLSQYTFIYASPTDLIVPNRHYFRQFVPRSESFALAFRRHSVAIYSGQCVWLKAIPVGCYQEIMIKHGKSK